MQYKNMVIEAANANLVNAPGNQRNGSFSVRVLDSPAGEMKPEEAVAITYDDVALQKTLEDLEQRALDRAALITFGHTLADWLLPPEQAGAAVGIRDLFLKSVQLVGQDAGLRLQLRLPPQLQALPWEYVYIDPPGGSDGIDGFLALHRNISLVRYEVLDAPPLPPALPSKPEVVVAFASPADLPKLSLDKEKADIQLALRDQANSLDVVYVEHAKSADVQGAIARANAGVFHFAGHGTFTEQMGALPGTYIGTGALMLEDAALSAEQLGVILGNNMRLVVLAACETGRSDGVNTWSGIAQGLVKVQVPAVVANQFTIQDKCAIAFDGQFYAAALVGGLSVEEGVSAGRIAAYTAAPDERDWGTPVLYLRTDDSHLFGGVTDDQARQQAQQNATAVINSAPGWDTLLKNSQSKVLDFQGTPTRPGAFLPSVYVHRADAEGTLNAFLTSQATAMVMIGDSGIGKTNTLCAWITSLQDAGHVAFLYNCMSFTSIDVEKQIAGDLTSGSSDDLPAALTRINALATARDKRCVLVFDAISEYGNSDQTGPETLFKALIAFIGHLPDHFRVLISCRTSTWNRLGLDDIKEILSSKLYYAPTDQQGFLTIQPFTQDLLTRAYPLYAQAFALQTPLTQLSSELQQRLLNPLMLRMLAEVYRNQPIAYEYLALSVFKRFYDERVDVNQPQGLQDQIFLNNLAAKMLSSQQSALLVTQLAQDPTLGPTILSTAPDSSYNRLLDNGILTVIPNPRLPGALGNKVRFAYDQLGGYVLALYLMQMEAQVAPKIQELIGQVQQFPLAWYTSQALLILNGDQGMYSTLAKQGVEMRELVVESLVDLFSDDAASAKVIIQQLVQNAAQEVQRTGLKAAYSVNPPDSDTFLWAAVQQQPGLPQLTRNILYLIWQTKPQFPYDFLRQLIAPINLGVGTVIGAAFDATARQTLQSTVEFAFDLLITIYVNHCDQQYVIDQTSEIFLELTTTRLHLNVLNPGLLGPNFEQFFVQRVTPIFTKPFLDALLCIDRDHARAFFSVATQERAILKQIAPYLDPETDLTEAHDTLVTLLKSDLMIFNMAAGLVLAAHAYAHFDVVQSFMQTLFEELGVDNQGRLWLLLSFTTLLPDTPKAWIPLLETFTQRLIAEQPAIFFQEETSVLNATDIALLPLGLAYGKAGDSMPYIESLLGDAVKRNDSHMVVRCVKALGTVGFYSPTAALHTLGATLPSFAAMPADWQAALITSLATMRIVYYDAVDNFLQHMGADEAFQRSVSAATDASLMGYAIQILGWYNNAVHYAVYYPIMRQRLGISALNLLADAATPDDFISSYTLEGIHLTRDTNFNLKDWTQSATPLTR